MAAKDCIDAVKEALGPDREEAVGEIFELLNARANRKQKDYPDMTPEQAQIAAANELAAEKKLAGLIERHNAMLTKMRGEQRETFYKELEAKGVKRSTAIHAFLVGREGEWNNMGRSVDAVKHALESHELVGPMVSELRQKGLLEVAKLRDPEFEVAVAREMSILNGGKDVQPSGNAHAKALAEVFVKYTEHARGMQNRAGAFIRKLDGYVTRQTHDQLLIARAGYDKWKAVIAPLLDERTFDDAIDTDKFLRAVYANLSTNNHQSAAGASDWVGGFKGPGNLAKRLSEERVLIFKGPDEFLQYNNQFGRGSLYEAVLDNLGFAARNTALLRAYGPNPEYAFKADIDRAIKAAKDAHDNAEVTKLENWLMRSEFDQVSGSVQMRGNPTVASVNGTIRTAINMAKLGGVLISSVSDIALRAGTLRHNGIPWIGAYANGLDSLVNNFKGSEKREVADLLNAGTNGFLGGIYERIHATDTMPGMMSRASDIYFKATGLTWWTDAHSRGMGLILARNLSNQIEAGKVFTALDPLLRTTLGRYGIDEKVWSVLQKADRRVADGEHFLTPDAIKALPDDVIRDYLGKPDASKYAITNAKDDLFTSLSAYYTDQIRESMTMAGARERALISLGSSKGTPLGEVWAYFMQFKQFPITVWTKHVTRELDRNDTANAAGIANLIVGTTILGYVAMTAKEYARGRNPRQPEDAGDWAKLVLASIKQGGGLGIYGDFLFSESSRNGASLMATAAGPAASMLDSYYQVLQAAKRGDDPRAKALKAVVDSTPFVNLFYTRMALDHLVLHGAMESVNPGYLRRYEQRIERENNQTFWLPPTSAR